jgi:hypothetical protein
MLLQCMSLKIQKNMNQVHQRFDVSFVLPVSSIGAALTFCIVRCPSLTKYAPIPTVRATTSVSVKMSSYACHTTTTIITDTHTVPIMSFVEQAFNACACCSGKSFTEHVRYNRRYL